MEQESSKSPFSSLAPVRMGLDSTFTFTCDKELACFTKCCRDIQIMLPPYDIIRLKQRLGMTSDDFLRSFTTVEHLIGTELPVPVIKMRDEEGRPCPFLDDEGNGCMVYEDRPSSCRYYPIGAGLFHNKDAEADENFFAMIQEEKCLGHGLGTERTVTQWREEQGILPYDEHNAPWVQLILKRKSLGPFLRDIPEKTLEMFFTGSYNIDRFRRFVFNSPFLNVYEVSGDRVQKMREDDFEMLSLAMEWLKKTLYGEGDLAIREQRADTDELEVDA